MRPDLQHLRRRNSESASALAVWKPRGLESEAQILDFFEYATDTAYHSDAGVVQWQNVSFPS